MFIRDRSCRGNKTLKLRSLIRLHGRWTANSYIMLPPARGAHGLCLIIQTISPTTFLAHSILRFLLIGLHLRLEVTHPLVKSGRVVSLCFTEISHRGPKLKEGGSGTVWYYPTLMPNVVFNHAFGHLPPVSTLRVGGGALPGALEMVFPVQWWLEQEKYIFLWREKRQLNRY